MGSSHYMLKPPDWLGDDVTDVLSGLVKRRLYSAVDDNDIDAAFLGLQLQP